MMTKFEKIKNQDYRSKNEIENKLKFDYRVTKSKLKMKHGGSDLKYHKIKG
jgi:hypothetical protein